MVDRRPGLIVRCADAEDVVRTVGFAGQHGLLLAVRGGGHNAAGFGTCDGGLVLDLSQMRHVEVEASRKTARVGGGATWRDFDAAAQAHGLATTGGAISTTGVAGLTLGGGVGWLMRTRGLACDNLLAVELVTADGQQITASGTQHADLFWALRGGGGNFGVATSLLFQVHPVGPVLGGMLVHPQQRARDVLRRYRDATATASDELALFAGLMTSPDGIPIAALALAYFGTPETGEAVLAPLRSFGPPVADQVAKMPYTALQQMMDAAFPAGLQVYWRSSFLTSLDEDAIDTLLAHTGAMTSPLSMVLIEHLGGAVARVPRDATAFPHRDALYNLVVVARWAEPGDGDRHIAWSRQLTDAMQPFCSDAVYVNYLGEEGEGRVRSAYGPAHFDRLVGVKTQYDPTNLFRLNQNIKPI
jgi:FAD/FMN-containing dehydrogenase